MCDAGPVWGNINTHLTRFLDVIHIPIARACQGTADQTPLRVCGGTDDGVGWAELHRSITYAMGPASTAHAGHSAVAVAVVVPPRMLHSSTAAHHGGGKPGPDDPRCGSARFTRSLVVAAVCSLVCCLRPPSPPKAHLSTCNTGRQTCAAHVSPAPLRHTFAVSVCARRVGFGLGAASR